MSGRFAIRQGDWKLIMPHRDQPRELYNLAEDPGERKNLFGQHPEIEKRLEQRITLIVENGRTTPGQPQSNDVLWWPDLTWIEN